MTKENFPAVMEHVYEVEGGFVDHREDPGGATNLGITIGTLSDWYGRPATVDEVKSLSKHVADQIYKARYWNKVKGDELPSGFDLVAMDGAVNSGPERGAKWLQKGVGAKVDGVVGPETIARSRASVSDGIERACAARMSFLQGLRHWSTFGSGWSRRVASVEALGVRMWATAYGTTNLTETTLQRKKAKVPEQIKKQKQAGQAQVTGTGAAGGGSAVSLPDIPEWAFWALLAGAAVLVVLILVRTMRLVQYHKDRAEAYEKQLEAMG